MHRRHDVPESGVEHAVLLQVGGHPPERVVLDHVPPVKVPHHYPLLGVQNLQVLQVEELLDRILELLLDKVGERLDRPGPSVLPLRRLPVPDHLQRGVLGDVEAGRRRRLLVAVHLAHHDATRLGKGFADLKEEGK